MQGGFQHVFKPDDSVRGSFRGHIRCLPEEILVGPVWRVPYQVCTLRSGASLHLVTSLFFKGLEVKPERVRGLEGGFILAQHILTYVDALEFQRLVICE